MSSASPADQRRLPPLAADLGIGTALAVCVLLGTLLAAAPQIRAAHDVRPVDPAGAALVVAAVLITVALRRAAPVGALVAAIIGVNAYLLIGYPYGPVQLCFVIATFEVARSRAPRLSLLICGPAALVSSAAVYARLTRDVDTPWLLALAWTGWLIVPWLLGTLANVVQANRERLRRELIARGALEERTKLAQEVHDVAGHGFALVVMQAGVALLVLHEKPEQARRSLEAIRLTGTRSLTELRAMLDTLHPGQSTTAEPPGPAPRQQGTETGLAGLPELIDLVRAGGVGVRFEMRTLDTTPDDEAGAVAYRVVQESLTNVLRHAGPTTAEVSVVQHDDELVVRVRDHGCGSPGAVPATGRGLAGMRRRVQAAGGRLTVGSHAGGGFEVEAHLPSTRQPR